MAKTSLHTHTAVACLPGVSFLVHTRDRHTLTVCVITLYSYYHKLFARMTYIPSEYNSTSTQKKETPESKCLTLLTRKQACVADANLSARQQCVYELKVSSEEGYSKSTTCDFLLMVNSNRGRIIYRLRDIFANRACKSLFPPVLCLWHAATST